MRGSFLKRAAVTIQIILIALIAGAVIGAIGFYIWTHNYQFVDLEKEKWVPDRAPENYAGSVSCKECHEKFYKLWEPSHHGKAMQPVTPEFIKKELLPLAKPIKVKDSLFSVDLPNMQMIADKEGSKTIYKIESVGDDR